MERIVRCRTGLFVIAAALAGQPAAARAQGVDYKRQLLEHLAANQPVTGTFEVTTSIDPEHQAKFMPALPPGGLRPGIKTVSEASEQLAKCRWAWATGREASEVLEGSSNSRYGILMLPEGTLVGYNESQFNLYKPEVQGADFARPALFYFVSGGNRSWAEIIPKIDLRKSDTQPDPAGVAVEGVETDTKYTFVLDAKEGYIRRAVADSGPVRWELTISDYARSPTDGRIFPRSADTKVYMGGKPFRCLHLAATEVNFPTPDEALPLFNLPIRKGALIGDRVQNMAIVVDKPTDGVTILTTDVPRKSFDK